MFKKGLWGQWCCGLTNNFTTTKNRSLQTFKLRKIVVVINYY